MLQLVFGCERLAAAFPTINEPHAARLPFMFLRLLCWELFATA